MESIKNHLEDGDELVWYKPDENGNTIKAIWHSNGNVDIFDKKDVAITAATFRILKQHWRDKNEHGVGKEPEHWKFNGVTVKEIQINNPDFWEASGNDKIIAKRDAKVHKSNEQSNSKVHNSSKNNFNITTKQDANSKRQIKTQTSLVDIEMCNKLNEELALDNIRQASMPGHRNCYKYYNDDWGTIAFDIDRNNLDEDFTEPEINYSGIYFLVDDTHCYIGQASTRDSNGLSFLARFREHNKKKSESYYNNWDRAIAVTNKDGKFDAADLNALESIFIQLIPNNENGRKQNSSKADYKKYEDKIQQIKKLILRVHTGYYRLFGEYTDNKNKITESNTDVDIYIDDSPSCDEVNELIQKQLSIYLDAVDPICNTDDQEE